MLIKQLFPYMCEVQESAKKRVEVIRARLIEKNQVPDKETDAMAWGRYIKLLKSMVEK